MTTEARLVVGVGAFGEGGEALGRLLSALPVDGGGMAFVLVTDLDPVDAGPIAVRLPAGSTMSVRVAEHGAALEPGSVHVGPPRAAVAVSDGRIELSAPPDRSDPPVLVEHLFESLARDCGPRAVGIVLSGGGGAASPGLRAIKAAGGLTIVQDEASPVARPDTSPFENDPGFVDLAVRVAEMPAALARFADLPLAARAATAAPAAGVEVEIEAEAEAEAVVAAPTEAQIARLSEILRAEQGFDLRVYKPCTIARRLVRRMALSGFERIDAYLDHVRSDPAAQRALVRDLFIRVTELFRDPEAFAALRETVIDPLVSRADPGDTLRVWVPGCATGEEAYSIAVELLDAIDSRDRRVNVQVFGTDVDADALAFARCGVYPAPIRGLSDQRLDAHFETIGGARHHVRPRLRDAVSFAVHDVVRDPPFSRMDLVSCRNLLIYLTAEAQPHVLRALHFALRSDGHLFLGSSESVGPEHELFTTVSKPHRIFRKLGSSRSIALSAPPLRAAPSWRLERTDPAAARVARRTASESDVARRAVLRACVPPTVVVSFEGTVLYMHGELGPYLAFPEDDGMRWELASLLRPGIAPRVQGALYKCRRTGKAVVAHAAPGGGEDRVRITARPAPGLAGAVILQLEPVAPASPDEPVPSLPRSERGADEVAIDELERELEATREDLRNTVRELESTNEELRLSHEESVSVNEELQSANEELEATTEELRSLNEELTSVNAELRDKVDQLEQAHGDLENFFASTKVATVFLDERLCVKRFTPAARELLGLAEGEIGRRVPDLDRELLQYDLAREAKAVLAHLTARARELRLTDGRWIARQVLPYRTAGQRIEGVVVTFADVTELRAATERLELRERQQGEVARLGLQALRETDLAAFMDQVVRDVQQMLRTDYCKLLELQPGGRSLLLRAGVGWRPGLVGSAVVGTGVDSQAGYALQIGEPVIVHDLSEERRFTGSSILVEHDAVSGLSCVIRDGAQPYGVLEAHTRARRDFTVEDANYLQAVASVVGSAIGRQLVRTRLALEAAVAQVLAETSGGDEALERVLEGVAAKLDATVCEWWWCSGGRAVRRGLHVRPGLGRVRETLAARSVAVGEGLVGRVLEHGRATWCTDLGDPELFTRPDAAEALGLRSAFGFPIIAGNDVLGAITVLSTERMLGDDVFLRSLDGIGRSLGDFVRGVEADARIRASEARKATVLDASLEAIVTIDRSGTIVELNRAAEELFGYSEAEAVGREMADLIVPEPLRASQREGLRRVVAGEASELIGCRIEQRAMRSDGSELLVELTVARTGDGGEPLFTGFIRDITERKRMESSLREADRQKDEFLAMLGHELRNPLAAIRSAAEVLERAGGGDPRLTRTREVLARQSAHMARLLDGLLDVSRIIRGIVTLDREVVDFAACCRGVVADALAPARGRQLDLRVDVPPGPVWVDADPVRLAQIVDNLLANALKYTDDGGSVHLVLSREGNVAKLSVRDTGVGIDPELLPVIFDVFRQSKQGLARSRGGLGVGLALVKSLVELHGGRAEAHSEGEGRGAELVVRLPLTAAPAKEAPPAGGDPRAELPAGVRRILIIEDNVDSADMLRLLLENAGYEVMVATRGREGIEMAREHRPDVVLCDIGLPEDISGFDVAKRLRGDPETRDIHLVALTGYGRPEDRARCERAGFDAHLTKPTDVESITRTLSEVAQAAK